MQVDSKLIFDHRKEIRGEELISLKFKYYFEGFDKVLV